MSGARPVFLALALAVACACGPAEPEFYGSSFEGTESVQDFTLTDQYGKPFRLAEQRGKIVLLFFGYAHCPDVCPVTLSTWARVQEKLAGEVDVEFVFVTVDPERDTAERLRRHLAAFSEDFHGLTGTEDELKPVYEEFGIFRQKVQFSKSAVGYVVDHSTAMLLLDREGRIRVTFSYDADPDEIVHDVRRLRDGSI